MNAKNHAGWQLETYDRIMGWRRASKIFANHDDALLAAVNWPVAGIELRIMPALHPAPLTPMQWLGELGKRVKRFYRINKGKA